MDVKLTIGRLLWGIILVLTGIGILLLIFCEIPRWQAEDEEERRAAEARTDVLHKK